MKPITADNHDGRTLLALRAGPMTPGEISRRVGGSVSRWLLTEGLVSQDDSYYRITEAGRAACPYRNPLAATAYPKTHQPETDMSREKPIIRQQVLDVIVKAGVGGINRRALIEHFDCADQIIDNHISLLAKGPAPAIQRPRPGLCVASQFILDTQHEVPDEQKAAPDMVKSATNLTSSSSKLVAPAEIDLPGNELSIPGQQLVQDIAGMLAQASAPVVEDIHLDEADDVEFAIFSSGGLNIYRDETTVTLSKDVLAKLRRFLGLFTEAV